MVRMSRIPLALVALAITANGWAQEAATPSPREATLRDQPGQVAASGVVTPTVEMWFYEQEQRRYDNPRMAVRRNAEARAQQRHNRIASMQWYGMSNSRPMVSPTPWDAGYSAHWSSNSYDPLRWRPAAPMIIVARPTDGPY